jgi:hypothetical protein
VDHSDIDIDALYAREIKIEEVAEALLSLSESEAKMLLGALRSNDTEAMRTVISDAMRDVFDVAIEARKQVTIERHA